MAIINLYAGTDMNNPPAWSGSITSYSTSQLIITGETHQQYTYGNFAYVEVDGVFVGIIDSPPSYPSTITGFDTRVMVDSNFSLAYSFQNISISFTAYNNLLASVGAIGLYEYLLAGSDTLNGSAFTDVMSGYASADVMYGNGGADTLYGGAGIDAIYGGVGNDYLDGGSDVDTLAGGVGDDIFVIDNVTDVITEVVSEGIDVARTIVTYTLPVNVDTLVLIGTDDIDGIGNGLDNILSGNNGANTLDGLAGADALHGGSGNDELYGGEGNDYLDGGADVDTLVGGSGDDIYAIDNATDVITEVVSEGLDVARSIVTYTLPVNVDALVLIGIDDIDGIGNSLDNVLSGNSGGNILDGSAGADILAGGPGNDTYVVENSGDQVMELGNSGIDHVQSGVTYDLMQAWHVENLSLIGGSAVNGSGNWLDNFILGNAEANHLDGNRGNDTLDGGGGVDSLVGGVGDDVLVYAAEDVLVNGGAGVDVLHIDGSGVSLNLTGVSGTAIQDIEVIDLAGTGNNTLTLALADVLAISSTTEILRIDGNSGDVVNQGAGWSTGGDPVIIGSNTYHIYTQSLATLLVDTDITISV